MSIADLLMKPQGKYLKAFEAGYKAFLDGDELEDNPNKFGPDKAMESWWSSGWQHAAKVSKK